MHIIDIVYGGVQRRDNDERFQVLRIDNNIPELDLPMKRLDTAF